MIDPRPMDPPEHKPTPEDWERFSASVDFYDPATACDALGFRPEEFGPDCQTVAVFSHDGELYWLQQLTTGQWLVVINNHTELCDFEWAKLALFEYHYG